MRTAAEAWRGHWLESRYAEFDADMATLAKAIDRGLKMGVLISHDLEYHCNEALHEKFLRPDPRSHYLAVPARPATWIQVPLEILEAIKAAREELRVRVDEDLRVPWKTLADEETP